MTREEAKQLYTPKSTYNEKMYFVDKIYDDFEAQLKAKDKQIANLKTQLEVDKEVYRQSSNFNYQQTIGNAILKSELEKQLKAKDEQIEKLKCFACKHGNWHDGRCWLFMNEGIFCENASHFEQRTKK